MQHNTTRTLIFVLMVAVGSQAAERDPKQKAPLLDGVGGHYHPISTEVPEAQRFFDQGLILSYGFNHAEAERSFREVTRLDPDCAMGYWGMALVVGPNINVGMPSSAVPKAYAAMRKALELAPQASEREQAYIHALSHRYAPYPPEDRTPLDKAYAEAMREVAEMYPGDPDAAVLYAEALMDLHPWNYWTPEGSPQPWTPEILKVLESVMEKNPDHPGANHFYIHAVEASPNPERGLPSANRLRNLVPGAGHLVHMPSHIYIRVGDYHEGSLANQRAIQSDQEYIAQCHAQGIYPVGYVPHNPHFLWATATLEGRSQLAIEAARLTAEKIDPEQMRQPGFGTLQHYSVIPLYALTRFGQWDRILDYPAPDEELVYPRGVWRYARGIAYTAQGNLDMARGELELLRDIAADPALKEVTIWEINSTAQLIRIGEEVLTGEIAAKEGDYDQAISHLRKAVELEDQLTYNEPPDWYYPVRHSLGAVLLRAGQPAEAEKVYREDLKEFPENGWALFGLAQSLEAQGQSAEAEKVRQRFQEAWKHTDIQLTASRILN
jgi:tetratricopeptide (TPR) repeat protein